VIVRRIEIENFRGIRKASIDGFNQLTILIGKNGTGKSSILEALYLVSSCASIRDNVRGGVKLDYLISRRGERGKWNNSRSVLWYQMDTSKHIIVRLYMDEKTLEFHIFDRPPLKKSSKRGLKKENWGIEGEQVSIKFKEVKPP